MTQHDPRSSHRVGERRRRREAQREAERVAEQTGQIPLPSRRELRRRALEEAARQEALATGEIELGDRGEVIVRDAARAPSQPTPPRPAAGGGDESAATPESSTPTADPSVPAASRVTRRSMRDAMAGDADAVDDERRAVASSERTATGLRPVVRTPITARAIRGLDETGALSAVQPIVEATPASAEISLGLHPRLDDSAVALPAFVDGQTAVVDEPTSPPGDDEPSPAPGDATLDRGVDHRPARGDTDDEDAEEWVADEEDRQDDGGEDFASLTLQPRWRDLASAATPSESVVERRSLRPPATEEATDNGAVPIARAAQALAATESRPSPPTPAAAQEEPREPAPHHPALFAVKILVLALVGVILGGLIWLLATDAFGDDGALGTATVQEAADVARISHYDQVTVPSIEECCAR